MDTLPPLCAETPTPEPQKQPAHAPKTQKDRAARRAAQLRENLRRRKAPTPSTS